jgi:hypothetical protein
MADLTLVKAVLIPMVGDSPVDDSKQYIYVQFNPESLKVGLSNSIRADSGSKAASSGVQFVDKSESTLRVSLVFDTSVAREATKERTNTKHSANTDVRILTNRIASEFMQPQKRSDGSLLAPKLCRFQWGAFVFVGMLTSYNENLDFFSPEGIPLRSTLALSFKENRYSFKTRETPASDRQRPSFIKASNKGIAQSLADNGEESKDWREAATLNDIENPRQPNVSKNNKNNHQNVNAPLLNPSSLAKVLKESTKLKGLIESGVEGNLPRNLFINDAIERIADKGLNTVSNSDVIPSEVAPLIPNYIAG